MLTDLIKIFLPTTLAFFLGIFITPLATHFFYKHKMWKKKTRTDDVPLEDFKKVFKERESNEVSVPCVGGIIIWVSVFVTVFLFTLFLYIFPDTIFTKLNFLSRSQTFIPIAMLLLGSLFGLVDDILEIIGKSRITRNSHWYTFGKIVLVLILGFIAGWWFFYKLGMTGIHIPFNGILELGILFIPFVMLVMLSAFSGGIIDGLDGLSGGVLASIFAAYSTVAFLNNQIDLATFCGVTTGAILAFLWFNIPPARFYMGETGIMGLTITLATLAFLTDSVLVLPVIAMPLVITSGSVILQKISKVFRGGKRIFRITPLHHHFEAIGWPSYKVTMRFWVLSIIFAIIGIILVVISR